MEMQQVRYFLAVAAELHFTKAAERCFVTQPALSRAIQMLEEELGGPLFHREKAGIRLSELGRMMLPYLRQIAEASQTAKATAREFAGVQKTTLRLGVMCTIAPDQFIGLVEAMQMRHGNVELVITDMSGPQLHERLLRGDLDVCIYCLINAQPDERVEVMPLFRERMVIVVHHNHRLANSTQVTPPDLDGGRYLMRVNCEFAGHLAPHIEAAGAKTETVYRCERDDWILAMTAAGLGYAFMPENSVHHPGVVACPLCEPEWWRTVNLAWLRGRPHLPALGALVQEAMAIDWFGQKPLAVRNARARGAA